MPDNTVKKKRVKVAYGKRPQEWRFKLFLFIAIALAILLLFYLFTFLEFKPSKE